MSLIWLGLKMEVKIPIIAATTYTSATDAPAAKGRAMTIAPRTKSESTMSVRLG